MHAALITGRHQIELREFPEPTPATDGVVVDITACGICGTDVHAFASGREYAPAVCGHEWFGVVSAAGAHAGDAAEGDTVVVAVPPPCERCAACTAGHHDHCSTVLAHATGRAEGAPAHGGFAPRIAIPAARVMTVAADLSTAELAQVEPLTICRHAVRRSQVRPGERAVVLGGGSVGLTTMQCARAAGAGEIIVVEPTAARREMARQLGADQAVDPVEAEEVVRDASGGLGADIVFECAGRPDTIQTAVDLTRKGGTMSLIGFADGDATISPGRWLRKEITVIASLAYERRDFEDALDLLTTGAVDLAPLHTATIGLDELEAALTDLASGTSDQLKVVVDPRR